MTNREKAAQLLRRTQRDCIAERIQSFGCDRTTISHNNNTITPTNDTPRNTLVDMFNRHEAKRASHMRALVEISPFCYVCSARYHKQIRAHSCECE